MPTKNQTEVSEEHDVIILGAGLSGLAAANALGTNAVVFEKEARPGGLVQTLCIEGFWFDRVIHLLYFGDDHATQQRVQDLLGESLAPCTPQAWVESRSGTTRFPLQMHLGRLPHEVMSRCLHDLEEAAKVSPAPQIENYKSMLIATFGNGICEEFLFPYNQKVWKRDLTQLAPTGFQWNITHPDLAEARKGASTRDNEFNAYNAQGWYPRPPADAPIRGMEVLAQALASNVCDLRLNSSVVQIDLARKRVRIREAENERWIGFRRACISTLPLPTTMRLCQQTPDALDDAVDTLRWNRVISAAVRIAGPRPRGRGHWRYYADTSLVFTRLVYMHEFDPLSAPPDGWGLLVEITEPAEHPHQSPPILIKRIRQDIDRAGALPDDCTIIGIDLITIDPAYVAFKLDTQRVVDDAKTFLKSSNLLTLGRYGRWEYSSMAQVMRDGFALGESLKGDLTPNHASGLE